MKRKTKLIIQKIMGLIIIGICLMLIFTDVAYDPTIEGKDVTPVLFFAPLGLYMIFTSELIITI